MAYYLHRQSYRFDCVYLKVKTSPRKLNNSTHFSYNFKVLNCLTTRLSEPFAKIDYETLNWSGAMELNHILQPGRPLCYRYTNSAYKRVRLPLWDEQSLERLLCSFLIHHLLNGIRSMSVSCANHSSSY